ncbi:glycosyltransferase [Pleurocapsa sp. CCALA 161]|uniref:glycosyltransferase n=1 Tax=Pleurocapsa sp. CCALA 161 TaxID=2107688 RepID=UPI000D07ECD1|nr:glycosyltransferase [Pleurocapsa sp. CCALA 161]PSB07644.1 glycosyltransferase [Pleurocapsa sp. CCALA 161]
MRKLYFLVPGTTGKFGGGGLWAELNTCKLAQQICEAEIVTYRQRESEQAFLADILPDSDPEARGKPNRQSAIFIIGWGFDAPKIITQLSRQNVVYHAHSTNYGFSLPPDVPIITVSRNTMGYWGEKATSSLIYYLPNQISDEFCNLQQTRDIDILVQTRKSSEYLLQQLIPALQDLYRVEIIDSYVRDLAGLFNRSKIYLYDSAEYWATSGVTEGFGLPPLEALACGCQVFSSVNHGLADYLDPGFNCHKIAGYALEYDLKRIKQVLQLSNSEPDSPDSWGEYRSDRLIAKLQVILTEINQFFDEQPHLKTKIENLDSRRIQKLKIQQFWGKLQRKLSPK